MDSNTLNALLGSLLVSLISLIGVLFLAFKQTKLQKIIFILVSFAVGALFGNAFFILLPESFHLMPDSLVPGLMIVSGILAMFLLEKFIRWRHNHDLAEIQKESPLGYISLITDALHNFIDGILIASSWEVSPEIGLATTLAVIIHEIPQEISDFGVLIHAGFSRKKALLFNFLAAITAIVGVLFTFWLGQKFENISNFILPFAAGGFIYLAGSDLIPELHLEKSGRKNLIQFFSIVVGLSLMFLIPQKHSHDHGDSHHMDHESQNDFEQQIHNH